MVYQIVSTNQILGKVIRDCSLADASHAQNMFVWVHEAVQALEIRWRLPRMAQKIEIHNHTACLPCELISLDAVEYNGCRLRHGSSIIGAQYMTSIVKTNEDLNSYFVSDPTSEAYVNQQSYNLVRGEDLKQIDITKPSSEFYHLEMGHIKTSFEEGEVRLFYRHKRVDKQGLPLIPDSFNCKEYIFWYVVGKLVFSGVELPNKDIRYNLIDSKISTYLKKGRADIKTMTRDEKEAFEQIWVNLIPPTNYYSSFMVNAELPKTATIYTT